MLKYTELRRLPMKKCEICQKEFDENLETCPYCNTNPADSVNYNSPENQTTVEKNLTDGETQNDTSDESFELQTKLFCKHCGNEIINNNDYCNHCGRDVNDKNIKHCINCGKVLEAKQTFCDKCGQKVSNIKIPNAISNVKNKFSKKKIIVAAIALVVLVSIVITGVKLIPNLFVSYDAYMAEGDYEKAYDKAGNDEKELVIKENIAAIVSSLTKESLKDSTSFVLREVYVEEGMKNIVLKEQGNNSYGGAVSGYVWYRWDDENAEFEAWGSCNDFDVEEFKSWDDTNDMIDKLANNLVKTHVKDVISEKKLKMDSAVVDRINQLNKNGKLENIKLLDEAKTILEKKDDDTKS